MAKLAEFCFKIVEQVGIFPTIGALWFGGKILLSTYGPRGGRSGLGKCSMCGHSHHHYYGKTCQVDVENTNTGCSCCGIPHCADKWGEGKNHKKEVTESSTYFTSQSTYTYSYGMRSGKMQHYHTHVSRPVGHTSYYNTLETCDCTDCDCLWCRPMDICGCRWCDDTWCHTKWYVVAGVGWAGIGTTLGLLVPFCRGDRETMQKLFPWIMGSLGVSFIGFLLKRWMDRDWIDKGVRAQRAKRTAKGDWYRKK